MVAISTDRWDQIPARLEQLTLGMVYLSDPEQSIIDAYGLRDATLGKEVARPASFILDGEGRIVWRHLPDDWRVRLSSDDYLRALDQVGLQGRPP